MWFSISTIDTEEVNKLKNEFKDVQKCLSKFIFGPIYFQLLYCPNWCHSGQHQLTVLKDTSPNIHMAFVWPKIRCHNQETLAECFKGIFGSIYLWHLYNPKYTRTHVMNRRAYMQNKIYQEENVIYQGRGSQPKIAISTKLPS